MTILHRPLDLTTIPDDVASMARAPSKFEATWPDTQALLQAEADKLAGRMALRDVDVFVEVDLPPSALRQDGGIKANARAPMSQIVAVTVPHRELGELRMVAGHYESSWSKYLPGWQANVRAVALTLRAMRDMARWGAATGQQYRGFAAIGATSSAVELGTGMTRTQAVAILAAAADVDLEEAAQTDPEALYRKAARRAHPDVATGSDELWAQVAAARKVLVR